LLKDHEFADEPTYFRFLKEDAIEQSLNWTNISTIGKGVIKVRIGGEACAVFNPFVDILKKALRLAHDQYVADLWTEKNATAFLMVYCLNLAIISKVIMHGDNCLALFELQRIGM
jgi:hypothetical protein